MIGASKILTVSYGTFSCTLEGFDEPFNTMKAIAEYFRDLAAEDRYFGAEPPTPDAAMLHRIAEREIQRRVEAKIQDNGVILRTGEAMLAEVALPAPAPQPALADAALSADSVAARLSKLRGTAPVAPDPQHPDQATYGEDQDAEDLIANLASPVASADQGDVVLDELIAAEILDQTDSAPADNTLPAADAVAPQREPLAAHAELAVADQDWDAAELADSDFGNLGATAVPEPDFVADSLPEDYDDYAGLTAAAEAEALQELERFDAYLIADVDQGDADTTPTDGLDDQALADAVLDAEVSAQDEAADADDALLASLGMLIDPDDQEYQEGDQDAEPLIDFDDAEQDIGDDAVLVAAEAAALAEAEAADRAFVDAERAADLAAVAPEPAQPEHNETETAVAAPVADAEPGRLQRARARVIKIRRADAPITPPLAEATPDAAPAQMAPAALTPAATSLLSDEAEAALQAELAALEAELAPPAAMPGNAATQFATAEDALSAELADIEATAPAAANPPTRPARPVRPVRTITVAASPTAFDAAEMLQPTEIAPEVAVPAAEIETGAAESRKRIEGAGADEAVSRLMAQTNSVMDGVDIKRRQSAIAHLKAAVVATEADRQVAPAGPKADRQDAYRHDLESVVRPRPADGLQADRPAPLVLVSEQRIDRTPVTAAAPRVVVPVRPRRVSSALTSAAMASDTVFGGQDDLDGDEDFDAEAFGAANLFSDAESFGDFAERLGAVELPDMLEAAAVYCAQVLGRPQFSRPMVLSQLASLPEAASFSREDGLRVFGTLMRQGRITKIKHGQFAITDRSPILAEALRSAS